VNRARFVVVAWREPGMVRDTRGIVERREGESDAALILSARVSRIVAEYATEAEAEAAVNAWAEGAK
jgi:hypothetical protein